jgi:hypothetical protein
MLFYRFRAMQRKSEVFIWKYQVAALATDTHKQAGSKNY